MTTSQRQRQTFKERENEVSQLNRLGRRGKPRLYRRFSSARSRQNSNFGFVQFLTNREVARAFEQVRTESLELSADDWV